MVFICFGLPLPHLIVGQQHLDHGLMLPVDDIGVICGADVTVCPERPDQPIASIVVAAPR